MKTMKNNINQESPIETISVKNDFEWFGYEWDSYEDFDSLESPIENVDIQKLDLEEIDKFVDNGDYMGFQDYLDALDDDQKHEALEYVENNYPEFMEDEEWNLFEPMKWNTSTEKNLADNLENKTSFEKRNIQSELWDALLESYKNAA